MTVSFPRCHWPELKRGFQMQTWRLGKAVGSVWSPIRPQDLFQVCSTASRLLARSLVRARYWQMQDIQ